MPLRIPAALAFTVLGAAAGAVAAVGCGDEKPAADASTCDVLCIAQSGGSGSNCPPPTCATGDDHDICPAGCVPQPLG
jgi:hypothetical protein